MSLRLRYIVFIILLSRVAVIDCQIDSIRNIKPVLKIVSVQPETGYVELGWNNIPSDYVAGFRLFHYDYTYQGAFPFATIWDPSVLTYTDSSKFANYYSVDYQIEALDSDGNPSSLSNRLLSVFATTILDTCNKKIVIRWNSYISQPVKVTGYTVLYSVNGGSLIEGGTTGPGETSYSITSFTTGVQYCFVVRASLEGGMISNSNKACISVKMQRPPSWINADYASIDGNNNIELSFTFDPLSEIKTFRIERKEEGQSVFNTLVSIESSGGKLKYVDMTADPLKKYEYRLVAINNCGNAVAYSNSACNIVLKLSVNNDVINLQWNSYRSWNGGVANYRVFADKGNGYSPVALLQPTDTVYNVDYKDIMYDITAGSVSFYITARENVNQYNIAGESTSSTVSTEITERITVPNAFTPDNDLLNDLFLPILSFTPVKYRLIITDRRNNTIFETTDHLLPWDGTKGGSVLPEGVYLWYLNTTSPSGKSFSRTGTISIVRNR